MVNLLRLQGIEVARSTQAFTIEGGDFPTGTFVVRLDQPYRNYAVDLLSNQDFQFAPGELPYDDVSWALPVHFGVETIRVDDPRVRDVALDPLTADVEVTGRVQGTGPVFLLADTGQEALLEARYRLHDFSVQIAEAAFTANSQTYPAGSWILAQQAGLEQALGTVATDLGLDFASAAAAPDVASHDAPAPRIGVWVPWADTDSIGWIRYTLDQRGVPYTYLRDEDLRAGNLREKVDVIVYGQVDLDLQGQIHGIPPTVGPMAFAATPEYPSLGKPAASDDITGGPGWKGLAALTTFVEEGGALLTLGNGSSLVLESGIVRNVRRASDTGIRTPGVELTAEFLVPRPPPELRLRTDHLDLPRQLRSLRSAAAVAADGLLHLVPRRSRGHAVGRSAVGRHIACDRPGGERRRARGGSTRGTAGDPRRAHRRRGGRGLQLQPHAPRPQPLRLPPAVERDPQLARTETAELIAHFERPLKVG